MDNENNYGDEGSIYVTVVAEHCYTIALHPIFTFPIAIPAIPIQPRLAAEFCYSQVMGCR